MREFRDDDSGYLRWIQDHPDGYIVNAFRHPTANYLILHRAMWSTITRLAVNAKTWTSGGFIEVCSEQRSELDTWAKRVPGELSPCGVCKP